MRIGSIGIILFVFFMVSFLFSCGGESGGGSEAVDISTIMDSQGGMLEHTDGVKLEVPEGAVDSEFEISITKVELPQILPGSIIANEDAYRIESDAGEFNMPVRVTLPLSSENLTDDRVDRFTVTLVNDTGYVSTIKDSSSTGCDGEARFLKIQ